MSILHIFEEAGGAVRLLPSRDGTIRARRVKKVAQELPPPTPSVEPQEPEPIRITPVIDPNPLLQIAAEELLFDPVYPLPEKPKRRKPKPVDDWSDLHALSEAWRNRFRTLRETPKPPELKLPDYWPVADVPTRAPAPCTLKLPDSWPVADVPVADIPAPRPAVVLDSKPVIAVAAPETFEVLAYRQPAEVAEAMVAVGTVQQEATTVIFSGAEIGPPAPKRAARRRKAAVEQVNSGTARSEE